MASAAAARMSRGATLDAAGRRYIIRSNGTVGRLTLDGADDPTFQSDIRVMLGMPIEFNPPIAVAADGTVVTVAMGQFYGTYELVRLRSDGSRDPSFSVDPGAVGSFRSLHSIVPLPDGRTLVFGTQNAAYGIAMSFVRLGTT